MSIITKEFTKEQLIEQAKKNIEVLRGAVEKIPGSSDAAVIHLKLARIALASLEAEAVITVGDDAGDALAYRRLIQTFAPGTKLYTAPPAPVSVPAAMEMDDDFDSAFEHGKAVGWNAYRAAMLQSFGNSEQLNSPVIPDGYALVPIEPTAEMQSAAAGVIRFDTTPINKLWTGNAVYRAMLAAAPQQEAQ